MPGAPSPPDRTAPKLCRRRLVLAFILAPLAPALLISLPTLFDGLDNGGLLKTVAMFALFGGYPATLIFGVPAFLILKRWVRPRLVWIMLTGGLVAAAPVALSLLLTRPPEFASIDGQVIAQAGRLTKAGWIQHLYMLGAIFTLGVIGGLAFWIVGVRRFGRESTATLPAP